MSNDQSPPKSDEEIVQECAEKISCAVHVTGKPNMETCEDLDSAFAYWEKDSLQKIIANTILQARGPLQERVKEIEEENDRMSSLLWGSRCVYCDEVIGKDRKNQDISDDELKKHVRMCTKHPYGEMRAKHDILYEKLSGLETKQDRYRDALSKRGVPCSVDGMSFEESIDAYLKDGTENSEALPGSESKEKSE